MLYDVEVAVVGLGLMGSSLAAAMRARGLVRRVVGVARRKEVAERALELKAGDDVTTKLSRIRTADVVILATPVRRIAEMVPEVARSMKKGALLTDVGSTKAPICAAAGRAKVAFIGGHPMAGNEKAGVEACNPDLYRGYPWVLLPGERAVSAHRTLLEALVVGVGSRPVWMESPERHDRLVAEISHVPYLLAFALLESASDEARALAGNSFRDATRVAAGPTDMILDFLWTNRATIDAAAGALVERVEALRRELRDGDEAAWRKRLEQLRERRARL